MVLSKSNKSMPPRPIEVQIKEYVMFQQMILEKEVRVEQETILNRNFFWVESKMSTFSKSP